ncbi:hypothetical protein BV25DRAFT_1839797 [Artomyces pyxidatus]|uniref:Uncharacterized protein n=1 Tax=Artomyces pyxidatus TaxID=48021 RepID=A0ACB8SUY2_9AGAM|nr:hypothetical protein BV25DRAFT_1839797 [Artomyces pyxidatus]
MAPKKFHVVTVGHNPGIYGTWTEASAQVKGYPNGTSESARTLEEAHDLWARYRAILPPDERPSEVPPLYLRADSVPPTPSPAPVVQTTTTPAPQTPTRSQRAMAERATAPTPAPSPVTPARFFRAPVSLAAAAAAVTPPRRAQDTFRVTVEEWRDTRERPASPALSVTTASPDSVHISPPRSAATSPAYSIASPRVTRAIPGDSRNAYLPPLSPLPASNPQALPTSTSRVPQSGVCRHGTALASRPPASVPASPVASTSAATASDAAPLGSQGPRYQSRQGEPSRYAEHIRRSRIDSAPDGDEWYAVAYGFEEGVFEGPFERIRSQTCGYPGAFYRGFVNRQDAIDWYIEHTDD